MLILPVRAEFVNVNFDKIGRSEFHCTEVDFLDPDTLEIMDS